jgi:hypothetical protein
LPSICAWHKPPQEDLSGANAKAGDNGGKIVPANYVLLLDAQQKHGGKGTGE